MQNRDDVSEAYYIVPNRRGGGKTIVRRAPTALTSVPLDDNFDAITMSRPGTRHSRHWPPPGETYDAITVSASQADDEEQRRQQNRRSIPLDDDFDAISDSRLGGASRNGDATYVAALLDDNSDGDTVMRMDGRRDRRLGRRRPGAIDNSFGDIGTSRRESPHRRSLSRRREPRRQNDDVCVVESEHAFGEFVNEMEKAIGSSFGQELGMSRGRSPVGGGRPGSGVMGAKANVMGKKKVEAEAEGGRFLSRQERGRDPAGYQMVQHRVLEDGPVRTVTMWREEVARSAEFGEEEKRPLMIEKAKKTSGYDADVDKDGDATEVENNAHRRRISYDSWAWNSKEKGKEVVKEKPKSPLRNGFTSPSHHSHHERTVSAEKVNSNSSSSPSTKVHRSSGSHPQAHHSNRGVPSSTLIPRSSTSGSIKAKSALTLESILGSCEPSLLHIAPILEALGIRREEHLRAIAKLSEETRDKEVREQALRKGVTVMEWAILLDRLHSL